MKNAMQTATHRQGHWNVVLISTLFVFLAGCGGGGGYDDGAYAGVFALSADSAPSYSLSSIGFRCAR